MDSLTQIVLGAAVGEVVLGKKVGNRAMVWGAIAATLPDLDVLSNLFMHPIDALAIHRGLSHSIFFAVLFPWVLAWITEGYYQRGLYKNKKLQWGLRSILVIVGLLLVNGVAFGIQRSVSWPTLLISIVVGTLYVYRRIMGDRTPEGPPQATYMDWVKLHFWAIFTHPLLDSCTTYGTQLFQPFSDYRVAFNNISVADPAYTAPFLVFLVLASLFVRNKAVRKLFNTLGLVISCAYMVWTFHNKYVVDQVFEHSLKKQGIEYDRYMTAPTILNNILWYGVAQKGDSFYTGFYSLMDKEPEIDHFERRLRNDHFLHQYEGQKHLRIVEWFSNGYYAIDSLGEGKYSLDDIRYGVLQPSGDTMRNASVFNFVVQTEPTFDIRPNRDTEGRNANTFRLFWRRIMGEKMD